MIPISRYKKQDTNKLQIASTKFQGIPGELGFIAALAASQRWLKTQTLALPSPAF
jgi:hypothetical protein